MTGKELSSALKRLGFSQRAFARLLSRYSEDAGVPPSTVNHWCTGKHAVPGSVALLVDVLERVQGISSKYMAEAETP